MITVTEIDQAITTLAKVREMIAPSIAKPKRKSKAELELEIQLRRRQKAKR